MSLALPAATTLSRRTMALSVVAAIVVSSAIAVVGVGDALPPAVAAVVLVSLALPLAVQLVLVRRTLAGVRTFAAALGGTPSVAVEGNRCELAWPDLDVRLVGTTAAARDRRLYAVVDGNRRPIAPRAARGGALEIRRELGLGTPDGTDDEWTDRLETAYDARVIAAVVAAASLAASLNVPYGGPLVGAGAFALLVSLGVGGHVLGERRLRRVVAGLATEWSDAGGRVEAVTRAERGTEWIVHTPEGRVAVGGLAMAPVSTITIDWDGVDDALPAAHAERRLETIATEWYGLIFA